MSVRMGCSVVGCFDSNSSALWGLLYAPSILQEQMGLREEAG